MVLSLIWPPPPPVKFELPYQDALTHKIGETIKQMKDDFFVINFHHICAECYQDINKPLQIYWLPKHYKEGMGES